MEEMATNEDKAMQQQQESNRQSMKERERSMAAQRKRKSRAIMSDDKKLAQRSNDAERKRLVRNAWSHAERTHYQQKDNERKQKKKEKALDVVKLENFKGKAGQKAFARLLAPKNGVVRPGILFETPTTVRGHVDNALMLADKLREVDYKKGLAENIVGFVHGTHQVPCCALWISPTDVRGVHDGKKQSSSKILKDICAHLTNAQEALYSASLAWTCEVEAICIMFYPQLFMLQRLAQDYRLPDGSKITLASAEVPKQGWHIDAAFGNGGSTNFVWISRDAPWTEISRLGERASKTYLYATQWRQSKDKEEILVRNFAKGLEDGNVFDWEASAFPKARGGEAGMAFGGQNWHRGVGHTGPRSTVFCSAQSSTLTLATPGSDEELFWEFPKEEFEPSVVSIAHGIHLARLTFGEKNYRDYASTNALLGKEKPKHKTNQLC